MLQVYNWRDLGDAGSDYRSDGECLLPAYGAYGSAFPRVLDGEFAVVIVDFATRRAVVSTDVFGTKPVYYSTHAGFHASTCAALSVQSGCETLLLRFSPGVGRFM